MVLANVLLVSFMWKILPLFPQLIWIIQSSINPNSTKIMCSLVILLSCGLVDWWIYTTKFLKYIIPFYWNRVMSIYMHGGFSMYNLMQLPIGALFFILTTIFRDFIASTSIPNTLHSASYHRKWMTFKNGWTTWWRTMYTMSRVPIDPPSVYLPRIFISLHLLGSLSWCNALRSNFLAQ